MQLLKGDGLRWRRNWRGGRLFGSQAGKGKCHHSKGKHRADHCVCAQPSVERALIFRGQTLVFCPERQSDAKYT